MNKPKLEPKKSIRIDIPLSLHTEASVIKALKGIHLNELVTMAIEQYVERAKKERK